MRCLAEIRKDNIAIAGVRRFTARTLPAWCGSHLLMAEEDGGDWYCVLCGHFYPGDAEKRPRSRRWRPEGAPMMRQVRMAL